MATFLTLPLEVRLHILDLVVHAEQCPPAERSASTERIPLRGLPHLRGWGSKVPIRCDPNSTFNIPKASSLSLTNKQLKAEVKLLFRSQNSKPLVYKLDLALMQGRELWPTWTQLPMKATTVDEVSVQIRLAGPGPPCSRGFCYGDGGPPPYVWYFYEMLERFFSEGPEDPNLVNTESNASSAKRATPAQKIATHILDLDFVDSPVPFPQDLYLENIDYADDLGHGNIRLPKCVHCKQDCRRRVYSPIDSRHGLSTDQLFIFLFDEINGLLRHSRLLHWGEILYCGVGVVRYRLRGVLKAEFNLAQLLAEMPRDLLGDDTDRWVADVSAVRAEFGLETLPCGLTVTDSEEWIASLTSANQISDRVRDDVLLAQKHEG